MSILTWGSNQQGQLGFGSNKESLNPSLVESFRGVTFVNASCGEFHSLAVSDKGDVYFWGRTREGQHGLGESLKSVVSRQKQLNDDNVEGEQNQDISSQVSMTFVNIPIQVLPLRQHRITQVQCGYYHCLALTEEGQVFEWGRLHTFLSEQTDSFSSAVELAGMSGTRGDQQFRNLLRERRERTGRGDDEDFGMPIVRDSGDIHVQRSIRNYYAGDIKKEEFAESERLTNFGRFAEYIERNPKLVTGELAGKVVTTLGAGYAFSVVATELGHVYSWGFNDKFQLGFGHRYPCIPSPVRVSSIPENLHINGISCGQGHTIARTESGECLSWGMGIFGQLGHGTTFDVSRPTLIEALKGKKVVSIGTGSHHSVCCTEEGLVYTWGSSEYGQQGATSDDLSRFGAGERGRKGENYFTIPKQLDAFEGEKIESVTCGYLHNFAFSQQSIFSWGWAGSGVLGHGDKKQCLIPKKIDRLKDQDISQLVSGSKHTVAICRNETTFAFEYKQVLNNKKFSDLIFIVQNKREIYAHQAIVGSRCPKLASMILFSKRFRVYDSEDPYLNIVKLEFKTITYAALLAVLHYLYTDHVRVPAHLYSQVVRLAQQLNLPHLEEQCLPIWKQRQISEIRGLSPSTFKEDLLSAIDNPLFSDFKIYAKESPTDINPTVIHTHKVILFSRCDYFRTLFQSLFQDSHKNGIVISDTPFTHLQLLLPYLYAGDETASQTDEVVNLLSISDQFLLNPLKQICEENIKHSIDCSNVNNVIYIAEQFSAPRLKRACLIYIRKNWEEYRSSPREPELQGDILKEFNHFMKQNYLSFE